MDGQQLYVEMSSGGNCLSDGELEEGREPYGQVWEMLTNVLQGCGIEGERDARTPIEQAAARLREQGRRGQG